MNVDNDFNLPISVQMAEVLIQNCEKPAFCVTEKKQRYVGSGNKKKKRTLPVQLVRTSLVHVLKEPASNLLVMQVYNAIPRCGSV